ncbi:MAG: phosphate ABC transporter substrate-binding protein PstS [Bacillota bacterium]
MVKRSALGVVLLVVAVALSTAGCGLNREDPARGDRDLEKKVLLTGAGASFPYPLYSHWIYEYSKLHDNVKINYQSMGSGAGIEQITKQVIDFGGTDAPMSDEQLREAPGEILHIPTVIGAVAIIYNLPEVTPKIRFTPEILADIYLGKIKKWNSPELVTVNPGLNLPERDIVVVRRSDGSGTTNIFTDYLSTVSPEWKRQVGKGTAVQWPAGMGAKGSEGLTRQVQATSGSIGYVELSYALLNKLSYGMVRNSAGNFIEPTIESTTAAAAGAAPFMPPDLRVSIVNPLGEKAYPIAGYTYILVYREQSDPVKGQALARFLWWAIHDGEEMAATLRYAPLPPEVVKKVEKKLQSMNSSGKKLITTQVFRIPESGVRMPREYASSNLPLN